jgi:hypothetical protein
VGLDVGGFGVAEAERQCRAEQRAAQLDRRRRGLKKIRPPSARRKLARLPGLRYGADPQPTTPFIGAA